jgi:hypothetical protein
VNIQGKSLHLVALGLILICLSPIFRGGLYSDDLQNFQTRNVCRDKGSLDWIKLSSDDIKSWQLAGRFTPVSHLLLNAVFASFGNVITYKAFVFLMNILAVFAFLLYLKTLKSGLNLALWMVFFCSVIQFRISYHDAFTSFNGQYQLLAVAIFLSLAFYSYFLQTPKIFTLIASIVCFVVALLISEVSVMLLLLFPLTAWVMQGSVKSFLRSFWPFILIISAYLLYVLHLRHTGNTRIYNGLALGNDFGAMVGVFWMQMYAALPITNLTLQRAIPANLWHVLISAFGAIGISAIFLLTAVIIHGIRRGKAMIDVPRNNRLLLLAIALAILPAVSIMPSLKYQQELRWGIGYLPIYLQNFGTAMLLSLSFQYIYNARFFAAKPLSYALISFAIIAGCISFLFNNALVNKWSYLKGIPSEALFEAVKGGILNDCPEHSVILLQNDFYWHAPATYGVLFQNGTGKVYRVVDAEDWPPKDSSMTGVNCYLLDTQPGNIITTSLYQVNWDTGKKEKLLKTDNKPCEIKRMPEWKTTSLEKASNFEMN